MSAFYDEYDMEIDTDNEYWRKAFKKCHGGIPVKPYLIVTKEAVDKFYEQVWKQKNKRVPE